PAEAGDGRLIGQRGTGRGLLEQQQQPATVRRRLILSRVFLDPARQLQDLPQLVGGQVAQLQYVSRHLILAGQGGSSRGAGSPTCRSVRASRRAYDDKTGH